MRGTMILAAVAAMGFATSSNAALIADFELNGDLTNSAGTGATITNNGATLGATGITFSANQGPTVSGLGALAAYTIDMTFTLDTVSGYRKLIDFSNLGNDRGFYNWEGRLNAYPLSNSASVVFTAGQSVRLTLSRDNSGLITAYIDDVQIYAQPDPTNASVTAIDGLNPLIFFVDDYPTGQGEASSGFVDYIRIYDEAITPGDANPAVPEPATWAMMIAGFGVAGAAMRRRKVQFRFA